MINKATFYVNMSIEVDLEQESMLIKTLEDVNNEDDTTQFVPEDVLKAEEEYFKTLFTIEAQKLIEEGKITISLDGVDYE